MNGASDSVLEALSRALQLDEAERAHLVRSRPRPVADEPAATSPSAQAARAAEHPTRPRRPHRRGRVRPQRPPGQPGRQQLGYALYSDMFGRATGSGPVNSARYVFLEPGARHFYVDGERAASDVVAVLRSAAGRDPYDRDLSNLGGELSTQSAEFPTRWAAHNVRFHDTGNKDLHHPVVGDLTLTYNRMELSADPDLPITISTAEPGSKSAEALSLLGSWAATPEQPEPEEAADHP
jgi:hypothetical protein